MALLKIALGCPCAVNGLPVGPDGRRRWNDHRCSRTVASGACGLKGWFLFFAQVGNQDRLTTECALDVVTAAAASGSAQPLGHEVLEALIRAVPADHASYCEWRICDR